MTTLTTLPPASWRAPPAVQAPLPAAARRPRRATSTPVSAGASPGLGPSAASRSHAATAAAGEDSEAGGPDPRPRAFAALLADPTRSVGTTPLGRGQHFVSRVQHLLPLKDPRSRVPLGALEGQGGAVLRQDSALFRARRGITELSGAVPKLRAVAPARSESSGLGDAQSRPPSLAGLERS